VSANARFSQKAFSDFLKLNFPILSDYPDFKTIQAYGVFEEKSRLAKRSYFIVDKEGIIRFRQVMPSNRDLLPNEELIKEIKKISG
jgi:peroxiredoxin